MTPAGIKVGDVLHFFHFSTDPPKPKLSICIAPNLYFCINSKDNYPGSLLLKVAEYPRFLKHDSFVACGIAFKILEEEMEPGAYRDKLNLGTLQQLAEFIPTVRALVPKQVDYFLLHLNQRIGDLK